MALRIAVLLVLLQAPGHASLDPATGSMIFQTLLVVGASVALFGQRVLRGTRQVLGLPVPDESVPGESVPDGKGSAKKEGDPSV